MLSARQLLVKPEHGSAQSSAPLSHKLFSSASLDIRVQTTAFPLVVQAVRSKPGHSSLAKAKPPHSAKGGFCRC
jgi:hypothetical protein